MDDEAVVVNLFFIFRVFLVGTIFLVFPRIARKGLVFGAYIGEAAAEGPEARSVLRAWSRGCLLLMVLALAVGLAISVAGWPVAGNLTGTAGLLLTLPLLYLRMHLVARKLAPPELARQARLAAAPLSLDESRNDRFAKVVLGICLLTGLATAAYALASYDSMPEQIPVFSSMFDEEHELADKTIISVLFLPSLNLVLSTAFAFFALLIAGAKRSLRAGSGGRSEEAQSAFRAVMCQTFGGMALFICALLAFLSVQSVQVAQSHIRSAGLGFVWIAVAMLVFAGVSLVRIMRGSGQGGARLEEGSQEAPLTGGLADNARWILGVLYFNKDDPSILVESRFGIGYAMNYGNRTALLILGIYLVLVLGLMALALAGAVR